MRRLGTPQCQYGSFLQWLCGLDHGIGHCLERMARVWRAQMPVAILSRLLQGKHAVSQGGHPRWHLNHRPG